MVSLFWVYYINETMRRSLYCFESRRMLKPSRSDDNTNRWETLSLAIKSFYTMSCSCGVWDCRLLRSESTLWAVWPTCLLLEVCINISPSNAQQERFFSRVTWLSTNRASTGPEYLVTIQELGKPVDKASGAFCKEVMGCSNYTRG